MVELICTLIGLCIIYFVGLYVLAGVIALIGAICEGIEKAWETLNSFGRAVFFGTPMLVVAYFVFYFIFYTAIPFYLENEIARIISYIVLGVLAYFSLLGIGWRYGDLKIKNVGVIPLIARIIFLLPYLPLLYVGFYVKQFFCKAFIRNSRICWNPHFITLESRNTYKVDGRTYRNFPLGDYDDKAFASYNKVYDDAMASVDTILQKYSDFIKDNYNNNNALAYDEAMASLKALQQKCNDFKKNNRTK